MSESTDNYLKAIYSLSSKQTKGVSTNALSDKMNTKASSVTDMLVKLSERGLVKYERYKGASLTSKGEKVAVSIVRRHRLWEVFLVDKLRFNWDEVHNIAEQLEHVDSIELTDRLENFLGYPRFDPHGDPIPDKKGVMPKTAKLHPLDKIAPGQKAKLVAVDDSSNEFLQHLEKINVRLGAEFEVINLFPFDQSMEIIHHKKTITLSHKSTQNMLVQIIS